MSTDEYVPSEDDMRHAYWLTRMLDHHADVDAAFDRFLARVRRDAEAELDSWMTRAYEAEKRAWRAEARIRAVRDVLDSYDNIRRYLSDPVINTCSEIRSALEGTN